MATIDLSIVRWRKSSYSNPTGPNCVEVAFVDQVIAARDSKAPDGGTLVFPAERWATFVGGIREGRFQA